METREKLYPGDQITAMGQAATIWSILYQDMYADPGERDIEFIDTDGNYRHWKECFDGGEVIRSGVPGEYYSEISGACGDGIIARIKPRRSGRPGVVAEILKRKGPDIWLGSFSTEEAAMKAIRDYSATNRLEWRKM